MFCHMGPIFSRRGSGGGGGYDTEGELWWNMPDVYEYEDPCSYMNACET